MAAKIGVWIAIGVGILTGLAMLIGPAASVVVLAQTVKANAETIEENEAAQASINDRLTQAIEEIVRQRAAEQREEEIRQAFERCDAAGIPATECEI